jgi:GNAT superfamily N-acetyltransferase
MVEPASVQEKAEQEVTLLPLFPDSGFFYLWFSCPMRLPEIIQKYYAMDLEGVIITPDGLLLAGPQAHEQPQRVIALQHADGYSLLLRGDLPASLLTDLRRIPAEQAFHEHDSVTRLLVRHAPVTEIWTGLCKFVSPLDRSQIPPEPFRLTEVQRALIDESNLQMNPEASTAYAILVDGHIATTCHSTRENAVGAEAYVYTRPEYRRCGLGAKAVLTWAFDLQQRGVIPFYNHHINNLASQALSESLGLPWFMSDTAWK